MAYRYVAKKINNKRIDEHRMIMQEHLNRELTCNEIVHHLNGNKKDNRLENLQLMQRSEHSRNAMLGKKNSLGTRINKWKEKNGKFWCSICKKYMTKDNFWIRPSKKWGVGAYCKKCERLKDRKRMDKSSK
jgi:hypothetical protein